MPAGLLEDIQQLHRRLEAAVEASDRACRRRESQPRQPPPELTLALTVRPGRQDLQSGLFGKLLFGCFRYSFQDTVNVLCILHIVHVCIELKIDIISLMNE